MQIMQLNVRLLCFFNVTVLKMSVSFRIFTNYHRVSVEDSLEGFGRMLFYSWTDRRRGLLIHSSLDMKEELLI